MNLEKRIQQAETTIYKVVFPDTTNHYDTLFGGTALKLMDEVAFIAATRFCRKRVVTVSSGKIDFKHAIPADTIIEIVGKISKIGQTSLEVDVEVYVEDMYKVNRKRAIQGSFTFVAINEAKQPIPVI